MPCYTPVLTLGARLHYGTVISNGGCSGELQQGLGRVRAKNLDRLTDCLVRDEGVRRDIIRVAAWAREVLVMKQVVSDTCHSRGHIVSDGHRTVDVPAADSDDTKASQESQ